MKLYIKQFKIYMLLAVSLLIVIAFINYFIDGGNQFYRSSRFESNISLPLLNNIKILVCTNYNDRSIKKILLNQMKSRPQVLVLGSSRTMAISDDLFNKYTFFNASVSAANLEDDIALYYLYQNRGWQPDIVVIGLDQWILNKKEAETTWSSPFFSAEYDRAGKLFLDNAVKLPTLYEKVGGFYTRYSQLLSPYYLRASIKKLSWVRRLFNNNFPSNDVMLNPTQNEMDVFSSCNVQLPNGTRLTSTNEELTTSAQADFVGVVDVHKSSTHMQLNVNNLHTFELFINYLISKNVKVIFYLPPYEPAAYAQIKIDPNYSLVDITETYFRKLALQYNIRVVGSYDPSKAKVSEENFIDDVHLKKSGLNKIFKDVIV